MFERFKEFGENSFVQTPRLAATLLLLVSFIILFVYYFNTPLDCCGTAFSFIQVPDGGSHLSVMTPAVMFCGVDY